MIESPSLDAKKAQLKEMLAQVADLRSATNELESHYYESLHAIRPEFRDSARNLIHYLAIRQRDIRGLQADLSRYGLSSLGRMEAHVQATLDAVTHAIRKLLDQPETPEASSPPAPDFDRGDNLLSDHSNLAFGPQLSKDLTRIMVTMPTEAAENYMLVRDLMLAGMSVARINCAHDGPEVWHQIFLNIHNARVELSRDCKIAFDLAGPKLRTGPVEDVEPVRKFKPLRNHLGRVVEPAKIYLTLPDHADCQFEPGLPSLPVDEIFFSNLNPGNFIDLKDTRGRKRTLEVEKTGENFVLARCERTTYLTPGSKLYSLDWDSDNPEIEGEVRDFPSEPRSLLLEVGQLLKLDRLNLPGRYLEGEYETGEPHASIGCDLEAVYRDACVGESIYFDDGKIEGIIEEVAESHLMVRITRTAKAPGRLKAEKGINLPDTNLNISGLTEKDIKDLDFAAEFGNLVSLSFVRTTDDIDQLISELNARSSHDTGIILKIETRAGFENLASLLLAAMKHPPVAVMIARGDLGVELGFERMAEVQEEILWLCEAAHVPVIWATQVLESLAKRGMASRGEITDAAMGSRAECVMLNKGPHIIRTVSTLSNILKRMASHQSKKTSILRRLNVADLDQNSSS